MIPGLYDQPKPSNRRPYTGQRLDYGRRKRSTDLKEDNETLQQRTDYLKSEWAELASHVQTFCIISGVTIAIAFAVIVGFLIRRSIYKNKPVTLMIS